MTRRPLLPLAVLAVLLLVPRVAGAESPLDAEQRRLGGEVITNAGRAGSMIPLIELWRAYERVDPAVTVAELERIAAARALPEHRRAYVRALLARATTRRGDVEAARRATADLGYVTAWQVVGPFDNEGRAGFDRAFGPEEARMAAFDSEATFEGKERQVGYRSYPDGIARHGYVDFDAVMRPFENVCGYATTTITSDRAQPLSLWVGAGGAVRVFWNGQEVHADPTYRSPDPDRTAIVVGAHRGPNRVLVKVCVAERTWGFYFRVGDARGGAARGVRVDASAMLVPPAGHGVTRLPTVRSSLAELEAAAAAEPPNARALEELARFLAYTGSDDPDENRARQLAVRAADLEPTVARLELAAMLTEQRGEAMRFIARAEQRFPNDPKTTLLRARLRRTSLNPSDALPILDAFRPTPLLAFEARALRAGIYEELGLGESALALARESAAAAPNAHGYVVALADLEAQAGHADRAHALRQRAVELRYDDLTSRRVLITDALRQQDRDTVLTQLAIVHALSRGDAASLRYVASIEEALGRTTEALAVLTEGRALAPDDSVALVAEARLLLRLGEDDAARASLRAALDLRPQDTETRQLLEQLAPEQRGDEAYAATREQLLARRTEGAGYPYTTLQDLSVNTVFPNGLGTRFRQMAVQIHDQEGARRWRSYAIQYDPGAQRVDLRLARVYRANGQVLEGLQTYEQGVVEAAYRIYYDTRDLVVVLPDLQPGDVVELRWRIDDDSHRNLFADYYGDIRYLQSTTPIAHLEHVLITPKARTFYFNEPGLAGLRHEQTEDGSSRTDRFFADQVPAVRTEASMPGLTEVLPYLHVSTYRTWEDVGRWWWGLARDQLHADEDLKRTVRELVAGAPDLETKVRRIHDWVVANTRYVGLEFGIHGFKPYRVSQIVQRGFGDCKDKASLLYTMLREAGVEAHLVLLRTRRNGRITDLPASLAVFDHAIAYVPGLDLYIDGTAEHSGLRELPAMDQGVTVLHVWPTGAELRRTPVLPTNANRRERIIVAELASDGSAVLDVRERVLGTEAAGYRATYQAEGTRGDRFERSLRNLFPGLHLVSQRFDDLADLERPIGIEYRAEVPQLAQRDGSALRVAPSVLGDLLRSLASTPSRTYPLEMSMRASYLEQRTIRAPENLTVRDAPASGVLDTRFGLLRIDVERQGREVHVRTEFELRVDRVEAADYAEFRAFAEQADRMLRERIVFGGAQ